MKVEVRDVPELRPRGSKRLLPGIGALLLLVLAPVLVASTCTPPDVHIVESGVAVYDVDSPGEPITAGRQIGVRIPLVNLGSKNAHSVTVLAQLLDKTGEVLQQRIWTLPNFPPGTDPLFDLRPFHTDSPDLIDSMGMGTFRVTLGARYGTLSSYDHVFAIAPLVPEVSPFFEHFAASFDAFVEYPPGSCPGVWSDTASLLGAVEIHERDPLHPLAIGPTEAEAHVRHLAEQLLGLTYDPDAPDTLGSCSNGNTNTSSTPAVLAYLLKVHGTDWGWETRDALRRVIHLPKWDYLSSTNVYNKSIQMPTMRLLFGEAACHEPSWTHGWNQLGDMFRSHLWLGGFESHELHYTMFHLGNLGLLRSLDSNVPRKRAEALFDLKSLLAAHMYLPGGQIGTLYTRRTPFFFPGTERERAMGPVVAALGAGEDFVYASAGLTPHAATLPAAVAVGREALTAPIRDLFLEKGDGYETWWLQRAAKSRARYPGTLAFLGENGGFSFGWHFTVLPGGQGAIGSSYGVWAPAFGNQEGASVRCPRCEQGFAFVYQWQPCDPLDTDDSGSPMCSINSGAEAKTSGYDSERMQVHQSRISLFDPRSRTSRWPGNAGMPVPRGDERTLTYLTNWSHPAVGGEKIFPTPGGWYVGRLEGVFIAYRPLGDSVQESSLPGSRLDGTMKPNYATLFELDGRSGGITILATADEFPGDTLADFAAEMDARFWSFTAAGPNDGPVAETDYRTAGGQLCRMKLEYMGTGGLPGNERRYVDCSSVLGTGYQELPHDVFFAPLLGGKLMSSPFVSYEPNTDVLTVNAPSYLPIEYDWGALRSPTVETPAGCSDRAYIELPELGVVPLATTPGVPAPPFIVDVENSGYDVTTISVSFQGDDCTAGHSPPDAAWLEIQGPAKTIVPGGSRWVVVAGSAAGCEAGDFVGELIFTSLEGNALEARLPVTLSVAP